MSIDYREHTRTMVQAEFIQHSVVESGTEMKITLRIDEEIVKKVRKIATDKNTTLTAMVRDYLTSIASSDAVARKAEADKLTETFEKVSRDMGPRTWTREEMYDRPPRNRG